MEVEAFPNYTQLKPKLPVTFWWLLRALVLISTLLVVFLLITRPETGLLVIWKLLIPLLPLSFAVMPGLWRNICPLALLNQIPRKFGISRELTLSESWRKLALYISIVSFLVFILFRHPLLNHNGMVLGLVIIAAMIFAFVGGLVFKGRSGWCGTFCPLAPIQKAYGHAPIVLVRNGYCEPCLGCQKNCYDFNPRAAFFSDISDSDTVWSEQRKFFLAILPGLIYGFFNSGYSAELGLSVYLQSMLLPALVSAGGFYSAFNLLRCDFLKLASMFAMLALAIFYWYAVPVMASGLFELSGFEISSLLIQGIQLGILLVCVSVIVRAFISERQFKLGRQSSSRGSIGKNVEVLKSAMRQSSSMALVEELSSGKQLMVPSGKTLLDAIEENELPIMAGCRMGMCGSDPVVIIDGHENLEPADDNELNTLRRLGLEGKARLACCCRPKAGMSIDLEADPTQYTLPTDASLSLGEKEGSREKIIIIGNGIAGISTAEHLREQDDNCDIVMISDEPYHFYNRMGLESVIYGRTAMQGLYLIKEGWYKVNRIDTWLNTRVTEVNARDHSIKLATGESVAYKKLVLATGAKAFIPDQPGYHQPSVFALRTAEDALSIRHWVQQNNGRSAVILGGGVLGVEAAEALHQLGMKVTIVHTAEHLMNRQLDRHAGVILKTFLSNKGIRVVNGIGIESIEESDSLKQVALTDGRQIVADIVLLCIGVRANTELAESAGLNINRGVVVDAQMRTSDNDIYCVGDAAELPGAVTGLWAVGSDQGKVASNAIVGGEDSYATQALPPVQLKVSGIDLKSFGSLEEADDIVSMSAGDTARHTWKHICLKNNMLVGGVFVNSPLAAMAASSALKRAQSLSPADIEAILSKDAD